MPTITGVQITTFRLLVGKETGWKETRVWLGRKLKLYSERLEKGY